VATNKEQPRPPTPKGDAIASYLQLPSYGACPSSSSPSASDLPPPQASSPVSNLLMGSITATENISAPDNNNESSAPIADALDIKAEVKTAAVAAASRDQDSAVTASAKEEGEIENSGNAHYHVNKVKEMAYNALLAPLGPILRRLLIRPVLADRLAQYPLLQALSTNGRHAALGFLAAYLLSVLLIWIPLWLLSLMVTEWGVYFLLLSGAAYGGRCLLRLLAFPGTNVRVYGEIENEFARYGCRMLEGGCGAIEDFAKSLRAAGSAVSSGTAVDKSRKMLGVDENDGWDVVDVPATYERAVVYKNRVLGVFWEVLHCLLEENGQGYDPSCPARDSSISGSNGVRNGFYSLGENLSTCKDTCKRNLCCERTAANNNGELQRPNADVEGITLSPSCDGNHSPSNSSIDGASHCWTKTTKYGNNPLVGDIGNLGNLTKQARSDGKELLELLTSLLSDLSELESSAANILRNFDKKGQLKNAKLSEESMGGATKLLRRARELRELVSRINVPSPSDGDGNDGADGSSQHDEEEAGAEAVRHRLEEQGGTASTASAGSSGSTVGMVRSAVRAFASMIDPPPHESIFGLDVIRGSFLARYRGARQFWVQRGAGGGRLDVMLIPSSAGNGDAGRGSSLESFLPLSPRKGRVDEIVVRQQSDDSSRVGSNIGGKRRRAVLYCNPNAGLVEVATGMGLTGGNAVEEDKDGDGEKEPSCWTEYYIEHGYDVYLFNYAGYGRSFGGSRAWNYTTAGREFDHGVLGALKRVLFSTFLAFKPSSESLKSDAVAVAQHLVDVVGIDELVIHGESIGGMAAAGAARALTANVSDAPLTPTPSTLLICDRTFCNLEAVAQRLVGRWTGNAIRLLTPTWSTDVARDFLEARCTKIAANDCADEIIHDSSSLKTGLAFAGELTRGHTSGVGWMTSAPLEYRMTDMDDVGVANPRISASCGGGGAHLVKNPPTWPADKHVSWSEAYHFAASVKRIGKLATAAKKHLRATSLLNAEDAEEGVEVDYSSDNSSSAQLAPPADARSRPMQKDSEAKGLIKLWNTLACCDGLCGHPLGHAVREGFDCTVAWLCCAVVFGSQVLAEKAEKRLDKQKQSTAQGAVTTRLDGDSGRHVFLPEDFDLRPDGYQWNEDDLMTHPLPIPAVLSTLKEIAVQKNVLTREVESELNYVVGMLEYIVSRITSKEISALSLKWRSGQEYDEQGVISTGLFLNLHCGHNNQYSSEEREKLMALIRRSCGSGSV